MGKLSGKNVAVLATNGFEQSELEKPVEALKQAGATVHVVSPESGTIKGWKGTDWGNDVKVDKILGEVTADEYDALVLPGGVLNPDQLRVNKDAVDFVNSFVEDRKPIGAICHGPWTLVETNALKGRTVTSYPSIRTDLINAGATWVDEEVHVDNGLVTSRTPKDLPAFCQKLVEEIGEGVHTAH
jgi:protease I